MELVEVKTPKEVREFLDLPIRLYKSTPQWIRPLDKDIEAIFDKNHNRTFRMSRLELSRPGFRRFLKL